MITLIGIVAGEIWNLLEEKGDIDLDILMEEMRLRVGNQISRDLILMSLGWLCREGFIGLRKKGKNVIEVFLRED